MTSDGRVSRVRGGVFGISTVRGSAISGVTGVISVDDFGEFVEVTPDENAWKAEVGRWWRGFFQ